MNSFHLENVNQMFAKMYVMERMNEIPWLGLTPRPHGAAGLRCSSLKTKADALWKPPPAKELTPSAQRRGSTPQRAQSVIANTRRLSRRKGLLRPACLLGAQTCARSSAETNSAHSS